MGGVALVSPGIIVDRKRLSTSNCHEWTLTVAGHKDADAANVVAKKICVAVNGPFYLFRHTY